MDALDVLIEIYRSMRRQGPGSARALRTALDIAGLSGSTGLRIADVGCGTGAGAIDLVRELDADVTAVDVLELFLEELRLRATLVGVADRITTITATMEDLPFSDAEFDVVWSEGAIYNMGFVEGVRAWRRFLKPGGVLVVSEITWMTATRPTEIEQFWIQEYPQVDVASAKISVLEQSGYSPIGYFTLPADCWEEGFYLPLAERLDDIEERFGTDPTARQLIDSQRAEIDLYHRFKQYFGYGMYIARA